MVKLLVPLSRSSESEAILSLAAQAALRLSAEVHLLTVVPPGHERETFEVADAHGSSVFADPAADLSGRPIGAAVTRDLAGPAGIMVETRDQAIRRVLDETDERLQDLGHRFGLPSVRTAVSLDRDPARRIVHYAEAEQIDLIAMRSHGRAGVRRAFAGSVAEAVVREAHKLVLLLGPEGIAPSPSLTTLLVCVDGSPLSEAMLPLAAFRAQALRLSVTVLQVLPPQTSAAIPEPGVPEQVYVERLGRQLRGRGIDASWEVLHGYDVAAAICAYAAQTPGSLVALSTHGRSGLARLALGSVAMGVVHACSSPVLVFHPRDGEAAVG